MDHNFPVSYRNNFPLGFSPNSHQESIAEVHGCHLSGDQNSDAHHSASDNEVSWWLMPPGKEESMHAGFLRTVGTNLPGTNES
jgi:hypothetical protein